MSMPRDPDDVVLTFAWTPPIEDLYVSWRREVALAAYAHRLTAERLRSWDVVLSVLVVIAALLAGAAALASIGGVGARALANAGLDADAVMVAVGVIALIGAALASAQAFARYGARAGSHRIAGLRYGSLEREMTATLATARAVRPEPDRALNDARHRMDRYAKESPGVGRRRWRSLEERFVRSTGGSNRADSPHEVVIPDGTSVAGT